MRTLKQAKIGETVTVVKLHGEGAVKRRLMDMGITKGVSVFIGEEETERIFPEKDEASGIDTDELSAFWLFLKNESQKATMDVIKRYTNK